jgi:hypothetical protein
VTANIRTHTKLVHGATTQSTIYHDGTYVVLVTIDIDGLSLTPATNGLLPEITRKFELLHFGYVDQWETFRRALTSNHLLCHEDTSLRRLLLFYSRLSTVDSGHVWMLMRGYINQLCGETLTDLRMGVPTPTINLAGLTLTLTKTQRKAAIYSRRYQSGRVVRDLKDWFEAQPQRFAMLGINADTYNVVAWVRSQFSGPMSCW